MSQSKFNFFVPLDIEKGTEEGKLVKIKGIASTDSEDSDGETLIPAGFDFQPLLKSGFLNWNHRARDTSKAICGEPTSAKVIGNEFHIEGVLYPNAEGKNVIELAQTLEKYSPNRRLGFSIEGQAIERDVLNPKRVTKARITGVAITQCPKNPNTLMSIIKGEYQSEFQEEEEEDQADVEKAMMVNPDINPPSVEGTQEGKKLNRELKKSEIYNQIRNRYTADFEKANEIYEFINQVKDKFMKKQTITADTLSKAFELLDEALIKSEEPQEESQEESAENTNVEENVEKGQEESSEEDENLTKGEESDDEDNEDDDEEFEKAMNAELIAKSFIEKGMDESEVLKAMTSVGISFGIAKLSYENCVAAANDEPNNGGTITTLNKSHDAESDNQFEQAFKLIDQKFGAIGAILKGQQESNTVIMQKLDSLSKSQENTLNQVNTLANVPMGRKSETRVVERFEKSQDGRRGENSYNTQNPQDMRALSGVLYQRVEMLKSQGQSDATLEKAVADLEIAKTTDWKALSPRLQQLGIEVY